MSPPSSSTPASTSGETDRRRELSPSPELDLPPLEFDITPQPSVTSQSVGSLAKKSQRVLPRAARGPSPPLEKDEKEFTQTADGLQKRKLTGNLLSADPIIHSMDLDDGVREESLFGEPKYLVPPSSNPQFAILTSPAIRPNAVVSVKKEADPDAWAQLDDLVEWDRSPENVELDELDGLLDDY